MRASRDGGVQAQQFTRFNYSHNHSFSRRRGHSQFYASLAEHVHSSWHLAFDEQDRASGIQAGEFHFLEISQSFWRHLAKISLFSHGASCAVIRDFHPVRYVRFHFVLPFPRDRSRLGFLSSKSCRRKIEPPFRATLSFRIRRSRSRPRASAKVPPARSTLTGSPAAMFADVSQAFRNSSTHGPLRLPSSFRISPPDEFRMVILST